VHGEAGSRNCAEQYCLFRDAGPGRPRAALSVFAMHVATFGGTTFGADYPGRLQDLLRKEFGPGFFSLFGQGTAGDTNHIRFLSDEPNPTTDEIGAALARTFLAEVPRLQPVEQPSLVALSAVVKLPLQEVTDEAVERASAVLNRTWVPEPAFLVQVDAWKLLNTRRLRQRDGDDLSEEVLAVRVDDDSAVVTLPHEVFVELGTAVKRGSPFRRTFVITMANDLDFYVPTRRAFAEGSYEVVTSSVKPGGGERLVKGALRLLGQLKGR
jgi:neutral ceramidase